MWLALWVLLAMLGQSVLPTLAYLRSDTAPELWNEICSVYGARKFAASTTDTAKDHAPAKHADCPLCLHLFSDVILAKQSFSAAFHLLLLNEISIILSPRHFISQRSFAPEARGPPKIN